MAEVDSSPEIMADADEAHQPNDSTPIAAGASELAAPAERKVKKIIRRKKRPARVQMDPALIKDMAPPQTGTIFNIWYNKWSGGDREDKYLAQTHAKGRCNIAQDAGFTRADGVSGSFFCLFFVRGICPRGQDCEYLHRLPGIHDIFSPNVDCFGRDKFSDYRDDMGGVGSFLRQNRTVYVGRIHASDDIEEIVARHFAEWGQIERTRVLNSRGVAFITYTNEANAQFAKEAMAHQSLDHEEILNVRWATADPNPMSQKREARRMEEQAAEAIRRALPGEFLAQIEGKNPEARKRQRIEASNAGSLGAREGWERQRQRQPGPGGEQLRLEGGDSGASAEQGEGRMDMLDQQYQQNGSEAAEEGGIFSSRTLAALSAARVTVASKPVAPPAGPLVAYDSDDSD